ncbi:transporter [Lithospermum erythrorhizon]|uniref:Transporter n=1 Tax=Lithospermum erythrorhizon TaxID=34254 RepID=A0AAV3NS54_LITER
MTSPITTYIDDKDLDDAALWAAIDSAAAASSLSSTTTTSAAKRKPLAIKNSPIPKSTPSPHVHLPKYSKNFHNYNNQNIQKSPRATINSPRASVEVNNSSRAVGEDLFFSPAAEGEVVQGQPVDHNRSQKQARINTSCVSELSPLPLVKARHVQRTFTSPVYSSPDSRSLMVDEYKRSNIPRGSECFPVNIGQFDEREGYNAMRHCLSGSFPTVSLFKEYQNAAMAILEKSDYTMISGHPFIKKTGWRKISFYFNVSYEIRDKTIEFDENRNVIRAEFVARALMQYVGFFSLVHRGGRFSDGWGSCERREKKFLKPNHDIPSTAETRAKNKACQVGISA